MRRNNEEHLAKTSKEALELVDEILETDRLMQEQRWEELWVHINKIVEKYSFDVAVYNSFHTVLPCSAEQAGENCKEFLRWKFVRTSGEEALHLLPR